MILIVASTYFNKLFVNHGFDNLFKNLPFFFGTNGMVIYIDGSVTQSSVMCNVINSIIVYDSHISH